MVFYLDLVDIVSAGTSLPVGHLLSAAAAVETTHSLKPGIQHKIHAGTCSKDL
jgi:hypothetical protein